MFSRPPFPLLQAKLVQNATTGRVLSAPDEDATKRRSPAPGTAAACTTAPMCKGEWARVGVVSANHQRARRLAGPSRRWLSLFALGLVACSPTYNWRDVRPEGTQLQGLMPCKPEVAQRPMPVGDGGAVLHMHSCAAGGLIFAIAWADMDEAGRAAEAQALLRKASLAAILVDPARVDEPALQWDIQVAGAQGTQGLQAQGVQQGQGTVQMKAVHFARGQYVYQAAVYGPDIAREPSAMFFEGLRLP